SPSPSRPLVWLTSLILGGCAFLARWPLAERAREADGSSAPVADSATIDGPGEPAPNLHAARRRKDAGGSRAREHQTAIPAREPAPADALTLSPRSPRR